MSFAFFFIKYNTISTCKCYSVIKQVLLSKWCGKDMLKADLEDKVQQIWKSLLFLLQKIYLYSVNNKKLCTLEQQNGSLEWEFVDGNTEDWSNFYFMLYFLFLSVPWLLLNDKFRGFLFFHKGFSLFL